MNPMKRIALKVLSYPNINLKKYYKVYRKVLIAANIHKRPLYNALDYKIMVKDREIPVRVFRPKKPGAKKVLMFFHGGGWVTGSIDTYTNICDHMANMTNHIVISVDYRLAPENPFPAGLEDCYHVTRELFSHTELINCDLNDITLIGDSAGGNLAAVVSLMAKELKEFNPSRQILLYPTTYNDHSENSPYSSVHENGKDYFFTAKRIQDYMDLYVTDETDRNNPYVAPLLAQSLDQQPKTLIITAEYDLLRDEGEAYGRRLKDCGNEVITYRMKNALHGFLSLPWHSDSVVKCYNVINRFLNDKN